MQVKNVETRGRPKKEEARILPPIYKQKFSDNSAIFHACSLIYVFEIFLPTKSEKRVGHKDGGFTIYDKIDANYCFDNFEAVLKEWNLSHLYQDERLRDMIRLLPAIGPKIILREVLELIDFVVKQHEEGRAEKDIYDELVDPQRIQILNQKYPYMRFVPSALKELKLQKNECGDTNNNLINLIIARVDQLWQPLQKILVHTLLNCLQEKVTNKYFKPFFSDAENKYDTYIGQLNLSQIITNVESEEICEKEKRESVREQPESQGEGFRKYRQVQISPDNCRKQFVLVPPPERGSGYSQNFRQVIQVPITSKSQSFQSLSTPIKSPGINSQEESALPKNSNLDMQDQPQGARKSEIVNKLQEGEASFDEHNGSKQMPSPHQQIAKSQFD